MEIARLLKTSGLIPKCEPFKYEDVWVWHCDYKYINGNTISEYIVIPCCADDFRKHILNNEDFVRAVIEPRFFSLQNDLSWNLYLVCVLPVDQYKALTISERLDYMSDKDYTRKLIIPEDKFNSEIPCGKMVSNDRKINISDPYDDWYKILAENNLTFCMLNHSTDAITRYINGENVPDSGRIAESNASFPAIEQISALNLSEEFRTFCFGIEDSLKFKKSNLLSGANGTGKTSILQALELVFTGEIRLLKEASFSDDVGSGLSVLYNDGATLNIPTESREKKTRESNWYRNRESARTRTTLNNAFHQYNLFSVEDTFLFAFNEAQPDYQKLFSQMLFGEEVTKAEYSLERCKGQFENKLRELKRDKLTKEEMLRELSDFPAVNHEEILQYLEELQIQYDKNATIQTWREQLIRLQTLCAAEQELPDISGFEQLDNAFAASKELQETLNKKLLEIHTEFDKKKEYMQHNVEQHRLLIEKKHKLLSDKTASEPAIGCLNRLCFARNNLEAILKKQELVQSIKLLNDKVLGYNTLVPTLEKLCSIDITYGQITKIASQYETSLKKYELTKKELVDLGKELRESQDKKTQLDNAVQNIRGYGKEYLRVVKDFDRCPLCGNKNLTIQGFREFLDAEFKIQDQEFLNLRLRYDNLQNELLQLEETKKSTSGWVDVKAQIDEVFEIITNQNEELKNSDKLDAIRKECDNYHKLLQKYSESNDEYSRIIDMLKHLSPEDTAFFISTDVESYVTDSEKRIPDYLIDDTHPIQSRLKKVIDYLQGIQNDFELKIENVGTEIKSLEDLATIEKETVHKIEEELESLRKTINDNQKNEAMLENRRTFFQQAAQFLKSNVKTISPIQLSRKCEMVLERISAYMQNEINAPKIKSSNEQIIELTKKIECVEVALKTLSRLNASSKYAKEFIDRNIEHISNIFCSLHMPKEFDKLDLVDGKIIGIRDKEQIPVHFMSTGQKTAVALSVFFTLNEAIDAAPKFILLDEPVSNIDDLNIVSLLDFLREMVISNGKQVFFTSANYNVKRLFRRKFSFLEEEFSEFEFKRNRSLKTSITVNQYTQQGLMEKQ